MPLTVLSVAFPFAPVGQRAVGGAEQILTDLDHSLVVAGHTSLVLACEGSQAAGELFPVAVSNGTRQEHDRKFQSALDQILAANHVDLIHMHGFDFYQYKLPSYIPVLVTLHLPIAWYPQDIWSALAGNIRLQCVSTSQLRSCPPDSQNLPVIQNGIALPTLPRSEKSDFALVLGRICPEKTSMPHCRPRRSRAFEFCSAARYFLIRSTSAISMTRSSLCSRKATSSSARSRLCESINCWRRQSVCCTLRSLRKPARSSQWRLLRLAPR